MRNRTLNLDEALASLDAGGLIEAPLRVPVTLEDGSVKWFYFRTWSRSSHFFERTHGCSCWTFAAQEGRGWCARNVGLPVHEVQGGTILENAILLDRWLLSLGAEIVLDGEWPEGCTGKGAREDRPPLGLDDWTNEMYQVSEKFRI